MAASVSSIQKNFDFCTVTAGGQAISHQSRFPISGMILWYLLDQFVLFTVLELPCPDGNKNDCLNVNLRER